MLRYLLRNGIRKGFLGTSRFWTVVGVGAVALRLVKKLSGGEPETVFSEKLLKGETLVISNGTADGVPAVTS